LNAPCSTSLPHAHARKRRFALLLSCLIGGMQLSATAPARAAPPKTVALLLEQSRHARMLFLGEMHGTEETPALVEQVVGHWTREKSQQGKQVKIIVALEYPQSDAAALASYLASDGGPKAAGQLMAAAFWRRPFQDGRSSHGMFALIESMRLRIRAGDDIQVAPFDQTEAQASAKGSRDLDMANNLRAVLAAHPTARVIALMGNFHARKQDGASWNPGYRFMAGHLKDLSPFSVNVDARQGAYWACFGPTPADCKVVPFGHDASKHKALGLQRDADTKAVGYDLALMLDQFSPSLPAVRPRAEGSKP
jgi:hypothetical protein